MDPGPFFYIQSTNCLLLCVYFLQTITSFHSIRLILCFQQNRWDWQPHRKLGTKFYDCVVQVSMLLLAPVVRPAKAQLVTPLGCFLAPTGLITLVSYWGKTCCCAHYTFLLGFPNEIDIFWAIKHIFWGRCRGVKDIFTRGVPHNQSLYFVIFVFLSLFLFCLLVLLSKTQKNSFTSFLSLLKTHKKLVPILSCHYV